MLDRNLFLMFLGRVCYYLGSVALDTLDYSTKNQTGGWRTYFFENPPVIFKFFTLPMETLDKIKKLTTRNSTRLCYTSQKF